MQKVLLGKGQWNQAAFIQAYTYRYKEAPVLRQAEDHIFSDVNAEHPEGFDNISLLTREKFTADVTASIHCAFEGLGCPEIILVESSELCEDGVVRYGACFEVVLYKGGINVWRHYRKEGKCSWNARLKLSRAVSESELHTLRVSVRENYLDIELDGETKVTLRADDLPQQFHMGITVCEGIARVYDWQVE